MTKIEYAKTPTKKLSLEEFNRIPEGEVFNKGFAPDNPEGINLLNTGKMLKWIAVKGTNNDWCIYAYWANVPFTYIENCGDKVYTGKYIQRVIPCEEEVLSRYRF